MVFPTLEEDLVFAQDRPFELFSGGALQPIRLRYARYGELNEQRDNAILVCHALSGTARVGDWWPQLFGEGGVFDLTRDCVIGINVIGSCYGSTGPPDPNPATNRAYGADFPLVTVRDWVSSQALILDHLGIGKLRAVIGGSVGGMQAIQWAIDHPERVRTCIGIGAAPLGTMGLALNHLQRQAIMSDANWREGQYYDQTPPSSGLALARALAMISYKSDHLFTERFARNPNRNGEVPQRSLNERYDVGGYLDYQGALFTRRFDANSYLLITKAMDNFDPAAGYSSELAALQRIRARVLLVGISSDWLFPAPDVQTLSERMRAAGAEAEYAELQSAHGHDGFLAEPEKLAPFLQRALL
ncbi:MAG TPA: homoserine O-acetyltransferase [Blastocatellia bacterium]|nr:homoserine O-acetyltransferase [Blastocatellia bacterium]